MVSDAIITAFIGTTFTYLIVYKKNRFIGNLIFAGIGVMIMGVEGLTGTPDAMITLTGAIIFFGATISLIYDLISPKTTTLKYLN